MSPDGEVVVFHGGRTDIIGVGNDLRQRIVYCPEAATKFEDGGTG